MVFRVCLTVTLTLEVADSPPASAIVTWNSYVPAPLNVATVLFATAVPLRLKVTSAERPPVADQV